jgi:hypothetical protein
MRISVTVAGIPALVDVLHYHNQKSHLRGTQGTVTLIRTSTDTVSWTTCYWIAKGTGRVG